MYGVGLGLDATDGGLTPVFVFICGRNDGPLISGLCWYRCWYSYDLMGL